MLFRSLPKLDLTSVELTDGSLAGFDCAVVVTDHKSVNYVQILDQSERVVDLRNALREESDKVVRL